MRIVGTRDSEDHQLPRGRERVADGRGHHTPKYSEPEESELLDSTGALL